MAGSDPRVLGGRYEVGELIGRGGMAEVHLGHDLRLGRTVAIKMLRTDLARDTSFLARFRREAQAAAGLNHPNVVAVYDSGEDSATESGGAQVAVPYIVMEHVDGQTLREVLNADGQLDPDEAARITASVLSALAYSHERGIVHRDIKPANVMVTPGGSVKVMDFGIARAIADSAATMTQTSAVIGTARYISPEQAQGDPVDARSDVYSTGCLFYELLTGRTPFVGDPVSLVYQHLGEVPTAPSQHTPDIPEEYEAIALHSLEKGRDERYQSAAAMRADLQSARAGRPVSAAAQASLDKVLAAHAEPGADGTPAASILPAPAVVARAAQEVEDDTAEIPTDREPARRRTGTWVLVALLVLALSTLGFLAWRNQQPDKPEQVTVPYLVGMQEEQARTTLTTRGLRPQTVKRSSNDRPVGTVIASEPGENTQVDQGSTVKVVVSSGRESVPVPDVAGKDLKDAQDMISAAGLSVGSIEQVDDPKVRGGAVVSSTPKSQALVKPGTSVSLVVSSGKVKVPDVKGKSLNDAQDALRTARLGVNVTFEETDQAPPDQVIRQGTAAGTMVSQDTKIDLVVARARPTQTTVTQTAPPVTVTQTPTPTETPTSTTSTTSTTTTSTTSTTTKTTGPPPGRPRKR